MGLFREIQNPYLCAMIIKKAIFVGSTAQVDKLPPADLPEYAFIGRSNVGKSSLINALTGNRQLAKTSQTPGKTQLINHFKVNDSWYLVDLPGYGFARTSRKTRVSWDKFIRQYLLVRENLQCVFVLIDSRLEPQRLDLDFCCWLGEKGIPFILVFTKADKQSAQQSRLSMDKFRKALLQWFEEVPQCFLTSSETRAGCDELLEFVDSVNTNFVTPVFENRKPR